MSVTRPFVLIIATMAGAFVPAHAQRRGTLELGAFAHYSVYDTDIGLDDGTGFGGRLGWFFSDNWSIEADGGFVPTTIKAPVPTWITSLCTSGSWATSCWGRAWPWCWAAAMRTTASVTD